MNNYLRICERLKTTQENIEWYKIKKVRVMIQEVNQFSKDMVYLEVLKLKLLHLNIPEDPPVSEMFINMIELL